MSKKIEVNINGSVEEYLTPQTKWEVMSFKDLQEIAEDDDVEVVTEAELMNYMTERADNLCEVLGGGKFNVLFG